MKQWREYCYTCVTHELEIENKNKKIESIAPSVILANRIKMMVLSGTHERPNCVNCANTCPMGSKDSNKMHCEYNVV